MDFFRHPKNFKIPNLKKILKILILGFIWIIIPLKLLKNIETYSNKVDRFNPVVALEYIQMFILVYLFFKNIGKQEVRDDRTQKYRWFHKNLDHFWNIWILQIWSGTWLVITIRNLYHVIRYIFGTFKCLVKWFLIYSEDRSTKMTHIFYSSL